MEFRSKRAEVLPSSYEGCSIAVRVGLNAVAQSGSSKVIMLTRSGQGIFNSRSTRKIPKVMRLLAEKIAVGGSVNLNRLCAPLYPPSMFPSHCTVYSERKGIPASDRKSNV